MHRADPNRARPRRDTGGAEGARTEGQGERAADRSTDRSTDAAPARPAQRWELYRVLAEPVRLRLLALCAEEELAIGELAELLHESQPNVSRHVLPLRQAGLVGVRKQGTRTLLRSLETEDPVVRDALQSGRTLCEADGSLRRLAEVIRAREAQAREFFDRTADKSSGPGEPEGRASRELGAYLHALAPLLGRTRLALDAGTGDGGLLDVLAPIYTRVVAVDRSLTQLHAARLRVEHRGYDNVRLVHGELSGEPVRAAVHGDSAPAEPRGADSVFAVRLLHHAARPARLLQDLYALCAPGGALVLLDYDQHADESMRAQADLWLGFAPGELCELARAAGFVEARTAAIPPLLRGDGPDSHLPWQALFARRPQDAGALASATTGNSGKAPGKDAGNHAGTDAAPAPGAGPKTPSKKIRKGDSHG